MRKERVEEPDPANMCDIPSRHPMRMRSVYSCHLCLTHACNAVQTPQRSIQLGTQSTIPYLLPKAAPSGCSATKNAKNSATAVFNAPLSSPISAVKCADSAFPIYISLATSLPLKSAYTCIRLIQRIKQEQQRQKRQE